MEEEKKYNCKFCNRWFVPSGHGKTVCCSCHTNHRRFKLKIKMLEYKGNKCAVCGYNNCRRSLSFHHIDETQKLFSISKSHCRSWEKIEKELNKCILVCANCHMEIHEGLIDINKYYAPVG